MSDLQMEAIKNQLEQMQHNQERLIKGVAMALKKIEALEELITETATAAATAESKTGELITEPVTAGLEVSFLNRKKYFSVVVPSWQKHGVRVWPEALQAAGIDPEAVKPENPPNLIGWTCQYILSDNGNPKKAISLTPPN